MHRKERHEESRGLVHLLSNAVLGETRSGVTGGPCATVSSPEIAAGTSGGNSIS